MKASLLPRYLVGHRAAILELAASRRTLLCGILFVISAGFAREYDGEDLLHQPWHLLRPLAASLVSGTVLFVLVHVATWRRRASGTTRPRLGDAYRTFMSLFWMTAPLAWLYAIPYERFLSPDDAAHANLLTLAVVAVWRVLLITRVISVLYGVRIVATFFLVMLFSDVVTFVAIMIAPKPVIILMGGIRDGGPDLIIAAAMFQTAMLTIVTAPIWFLGAVVGLGFLRPTYAGFASTAEKTPSRGLLSLAVAGIVAWAAILPFTQPEQINRHDAERLLRAGDVAAALRAMSSRTPDDYPPNWDPPPRVLYGDAVPDLDAVRAALRAEWPAPWVAERYVTKIRRDLVRRLVPTVGGLFTLADAIADVEAYRDPGEAAARHGDAMRFLLEYDTRLTAEERGGLERLLAAPASPNEDDDSP